MTENVKESKAVPEPTLRRLPTYVHYLTHRVKKTRQFISTSEIAKALKLDPTQVRKDLAVTGITGTPRVGYCVAELVEAIGNFLGWNNLTDAFLVGVGNLGTALLGYQRLKQYGVKIVAAFDTREKVVGTEIHGVSVMHVDKMANLAKRMGIHIGIITVPAQAAAEVADKMVRAGICAIWNFTPTSLELPESVIVQNMDLYASLAVLSRKLHERLK